MESAISADNKENAREGKAPHNGLKIGV